MSFRRSAINSFAADFCTGEAPDAALSIVFIKFPTSLRLAETDCCLNCSSDIVQICITTNFVRQVIFFDNVTMLGDAVTQEAITMKNLSSQLADLKLARTTASIINRVGCSRETFRRIERGDSVKLSTLKSIAEAMGSTSTEWICIAAAWAKHELEAELGRDADRISIEINTAKPTGKRKPSQHDIAAQSFDGLPNEQQVNIIKTMVRPEVIKTLPSLLAMYDTLHPTGNSKSPPLGK